MNATRRAWLLAAGAAVWAGSSTLPVHAQGKARKLVLGQSVPLTGAASEIGLAFAAGAKLYVDAFNGRKPGTGLSVELKQLDDGYDPSRAAANAAKLLSEGADLLFGFVGTASAESSSLVAQQQNAILFAPFAAADSLRDGAHTHVFHVRPSMSDEAFKMVRHCATLNQTRIAVVAEDDAMGRAGVEAINHAVAELKMPPIVATALIPVNSDKVDGAVALINKAQPHAIIQVALFNSTAHFIRKMRRAGFAGTFMSFSVVGIDPLFTALGREISGIVVSQVVPSPKNGTIPIVREYLAAIESSDQSPTYESLEGFIAAKTAIEGFQRAKNSDRTSLMAAMTSLTNYDVGGFRINLRAGIRDSVRSIDLITITSDGKVVR